MQRNTSQSIMQRIAPENVQPKRRTKITVVGVGAVGMAAAYSIMLRGVANEIALVDCLGDKVQGEVLDMQQCQQFCHGGAQVVVGSTSYDSSKDSDIVLITAGARQQEGESRLNLVQRNVDIFKKIIPQIVEKSPNCIIVVVSNPVDILTFVAWKLSGFPSHRVIGTGTMLDSARFRHMLSQRLNISASSVHGYIIGEHGDSSVPVWSCVNIAGVRLSSQLPQIGTAQDPDNYGQIHKDVINSAYEIIKLKGYTNWAIGVTCATLCQAILSNHHSVYPLCTNSNGFHGITGDVYLSLPCLVTSAGVTHVIPQELNEQEVAKIQQSAKTILETTSGIKW